jgi:hypothetical protein
VTTRWSKECKVEPKAHQAKTKCIKNKECKQDSSNRILFYFLNYQKQSFEIFKQAKFED